MTKLMSVTFAAILVSLGLFLGGCAQKLANYDYNPGFSYANYQTYALQQSDKQSYQSLDGSRIEAALRQTLEPRYQAAAPEQADFIVNYYLEASEQIDQSGFSFGFGVFGSNLGVGVSTGPEARQETEGKLVLEVVDTASDQLVWSARARRHLKDGMIPTERRELIQKLVAEMLQNFPPQ
ncbi:MAG: DUF4136 domain-containing protein [Pseudomonadota bacterium]|nr:DUF4136 domain-containing protein [Pseudomonadota bacterium]